MIEAVAHARSRVFDGRLGPMVPPFVNWIICRDLGEFVIDEQAVSRMHESEIAGVIRRDDRLTHQHGFRETKPEPLSAMERNEAVAHLDKTVGPRSRKHF